MRVFVGEPERNQLRIETEAFGLLVGHASKVLQANERNTLSFYDKLSGIRRTDSDHKDYINVGVTLEESPTLLFSVSGKRDYIDSLQHSAEIYATCKCCGSNDFQKMWPCWV
jgi:hypothetical protein